MRRGQEISCDIICYFLISLTGETLRVLMRRYLKEPVWPPSFVSSPWACA